MNYFEFGFLFVALPSQHTFLALMKPYACLQSASLPCICTVLPAEPKSNQSCDYQLTRSVSLSLYLWEMWIHSLMRDKLLNNGPEHLLSAIIVMVEVLIAFRFKTRDGISQRNEKACSS